MVDYFPNHVTYNNKSGAATITTITGITKSLFLGSCSHTLISTYFHKFKKLVYLWFLLDTKLVIVVLFGPDTWRRYLVKKRKIWEKMKFHVFPCALYCSTTDCALYCSTTDFSIYKYVLRDDEVLQMFVTCSKEGNPGRHLAWRFRYVSDLENVSPHNFGNNRAWSFPVTLSAELLHLF